VPRFLYFDESGQTIIAALYEKDAENMEKKMCI
jgi:hypothetical protein